MTSRIRIEPPNQLPSSGVTSIQYKQWKIALKIFMQQTPEYREFFPGGRYTKWLPYEDNPHRIAELATGDAAPDDVDEVEHLAQRRIHLETFLGIIARYSDEGDFDDIMEKSSSLEWIHVLHERRYGIQKKGRYFHRLDSIRFDKSTMTDYFKFYTDLRSCFKSNLRKKGDMIKYKNAKLEEDEKISPTTECLIIQIALERIDARLPEEIDRIFGHQMDDSTTLMDLQSEIFSYIPRALATLDKEEQMQCNARHVCGQNHGKKKEEIDINAMYNKPTRNQPAQGYKPRRPARPQQRQVKFCRVCQALDLPTTTFTSHDTRDCSRKAVLQEIHVEDNDDSQTDVDNEYDE